MDILFSTQNGEPTSLAIVGLMTTPQIVDVRAGQSFFGVRFRTGMAAAFLPAAPQLNDRIEPLENVLGLVIYATDLVASQKKIKDAEGKIVKDIFAFPGGRRFHFMDPNGNELAVWSDQAG